MKLLSYRHDGADRYGAAVDGGVIDLGRRLGARYPSLRSALADGGLKTLEAAARGAGPDHGLDEIEFALPVPRPDKIFCAGRNYRAYHEVVETGGAPAYPSIFSRLISSFAAHRQAILKPKIADSLDYEGELVAIIGSRGRHIAQQDALDHVAGYTAMNEGTVREWAKMGTQNTPAKNFYRSGAIGPWLVTADEIADPGQLRIRTRRNGTVVQDGGTELMIFDVAYLIAHVSKFTWLDRLEIEISGIGTLANPIEAE